jgi:hypothetical protein
VAGLFKWGGRKHDDARARLPTAQVQADPPTRSKVLPRFLSALSAAESTVLLNLGPVIGQNISFLGDRLSCKIFVEDLFPEIEAHAKRGAQAALPAALVARFQHAPESINGILCWDVFDFLDRNASKALAARLVSFLRPGGVLYGFFGASTGDITQATRFVIEAPNALRLKTVPVPPRRRNVMVTRDINRMFDGLVVTESVLLKSNTRETLFRKP